MHSTRTGSDTLHPRRRLADDIVDFNLAAIQLDLFQREGGAHHTRNLGLRISGIHRRLDVLQARLRRRAVEVDVEGNLPITQLVRQLREGLNGKHACRLDPERRTLTGSQGAAAAQSRPEPLPRQERRDVELIPA